MAAHKNATQNTDRKVGRNERCPCGSGKKHKVCCGRKRKRVAPLAWLAIAAVAVIAVVALASVFSSAGENRSVQTCPPGQTWSTSHGHCH